LKVHFRKTFLAGTFAAVPIVVTGFIIWYVDRHTTPLSASVTEYLFGREIHLPFLGMVIALGAIYFVGLLTQSVIGGFFIRMVDKLLGRLPGFSALYGAWKQISFTPGGGEGIYAKVVLIPDETGHLRILAFSTGEPIPGHPDIVCVYAPNAPNPIQGKVYFVDKSHITPLDISPEEAFKILISVGNYVPAHLLAGKTTGVTKA